MSPLRSKSSYSSVTVHVCHHKDTGFPLVCSVKLQRCLLTAVTMSTHVFGVAFRLYICTYTRYDIVTINTS